MREKYLMPGQPGREGHYLTAARKMLAEEMSIDEALRNKKLIEQLETIIHPDREHSITWAGARRTIKRIGEMTAVEGRAAAKGEVSRERLRAWRKIELGLMADMKEYAKTVSSPGSNIYEELEAANKLWRDTVLPFYKTPMVQDVVGGTFDRNLDMDSVVAAFLNPAKPIRSGHMVRMLEPSDQDMARFLVVRQAMDNAKAGSIFLNPQAFAKELERLAPLFDTAFSREQDQMLRGFITLTEEASRAFTKASAIGPLMAGGSAALIGANKRGDAPLKAWLASMVGARFLLGTRAGTSIVRQAANVQNSKELTQLVKMAETGFIRYMESNYPEMLREINPGLPKGPYEKFNPFTDPYLQSQPPRQDLIRR